MFYLRLLSTLSLMVYLQNVSGQLPGINILFPDEASNFIAPVTTAQPMTPAESESMMNGISNMEEFASYFNISMPPKRSGISSRLGPSIVEELPQATCIPEDTTVPLDLPSDEGVRYFPTCVRVKRCGGCCFIPLHSCQPVKPETKQVRVMKIDGRSARSRASPRARRRRQSQYEIVNVEHHLQCSCECIIKEDSCNPTIQDYNRNQCACNCKNSGEQDSCLDSRDHYWNKDLCRCQCRNMRACSSGQHFSQATCTCV